MKKMMMAVLALGMATAASAQEKAVALEPRVGINLIAPYESGENCMFGYNIGTMVSIPLTEHFYLQPGISELSPAIQQQRQSITYSGLCFLSASGERSDLAF